MQNRYLALLAASTLAGPAWLWRTPATAERAWSTQLHVHGSFSDGLDSIDTQLAEAVELGVDVVWWSDEDFRLASYRHVSSFGFDAPSEPIDGGEEWTARGVLEVGKHKVLGLREHRSARKRRAGEGSERESAEFTREHSRDGTPSFRVQRAARGALEFGRSEGRFLADRELHQRPLACGVTLQVAVLPFQHDADGRAFVHVALSEHPRQNRVPARRYGVHYYLSNEEREPWRVSGTLNVPVPFRAGEWNELTLELTRDVVAGFPFLVGADNALGAIDFGVEARAQSEPVAHFDDLRIEQRLRGPAAFARQRELLEEVGRKHPGPRQYQGVEVSCGALHLGELSVGTELLDRDALLAASDLVAEDAGGFEQGGFDQGAFERLVARRAVELAHARGGLISYNHMFGTGVPRRVAAPTPEQVLEDLARERVLGADLLELGHGEHDGRRLDQHLWVWDRLAQRGLFPVGIGASDFHNAPAAPRRSSPGGLVTWILAPSPERVSLIEGLRGGRAFFGDRAGFEGVLELETARGFRMGQIVLTDRDEVLVEVEVTGLAEGDDVAVIESTGPVAMLAGAGATLREEHRMKTLPGLVRVELNDAKGETRVLSNPIHFVREAPPGGIPAARAGLDVGGVRSFLMRGFTLEGARVQQLEGAAGVRIEGTASNGELHLDVPLALTSPEVHLEGLSGDVIELGGNLVLTRLEGAGAIVLRARTR